MSDSSRMPVLARLYSGQAATFSEVELEVSTDSIQLGDVAFSSAQLQVSPRSGRADRLISLPDGRELQVPDADWCERLPCPEQSARSIAWLEDRQAVAIASLAGILGFAVWFWWVGLPWVAQQAALRVPFAYEQKFGERSLTLLEEAEWFDESALSDVQRESTLASFTRLAAALPKEDYAYRLELRSSNMGANAFALPGGLIVATDELVELCTVEETAAVLAHELAHAQQRHVMQGVLSDASIAALLSSVFGDVTSSSLAVVSVPALLLELGYTRDQEREADEGAFALLRQVGLRPALLGDALAKLEGYYTQDGEGFSGELDDTDADGSAGDPASTSGDGEEQEAEAASTSPQDAGKTPPAPGNWVELHEAAESELSDETDEWSESDAEAPPPISDREYERWRADRRREEEREEAWSFLSTHPITAERIARARAQR